MAKSPGTPKGKAAAPAQFDMNSRERKGGKGRPGGGGGGGRGRDDKRPPSRIVSLPPALVDRGDGWVIQKIGRIDQASHVAMGAEYHLVFEGHDPLAFDYLKAARDRAKEPPPEKPQIEEVAAAPLEEAPGEDAPRHVPDEGAEAGQVHGVEAQDREAKAGEAHAAEAGTGEEGV